MAKTVTHQDENNETSPAMFGDAEHLDVVTQKTFPELVFQLLSEKDPTDIQLKLFNILLNISIDHGPHTPSGVETVKAAKEGKTISESLAAGILQINDKHGGAIEPLMRELYRLQVSGFTAKELIDEYDKAGKFLPGFGHRVYKEKDPRAELILNELGESEFIAVARGIEKVLEEKKGKKLVLNIDGAIAVVLCSWDWDPKLGKAVFLIARTPGLIGQYLNNS